MAAGRASAIKTAQIRLRINRHGAKQAMRATARKIVKICGFARRKRGAGLEFERGETRARKKIKFRIKMQIKLNGKAYETAASDLEGLKREVKFSGEIAVINGY
ncbi:ThiS-like ubiquitin domain-containing protein, partial [uncultured Campylobacter sp.]|uniref:ThiS-like ubiquitin domain-containing protein n=1 Tax=uncultured Campylobacter sp. TaxID=218934 RepID=UPI00345D50A7